MAVDAQLATGGDTIELLQQVARLQALLEASRQVHSTIREEEVLDSALRIVVRELEMAGAAFSGTGHAYGDIPASLADGHAGAEGYSSQKSANDEAAQLLIYPLADRDGNKMTELVVASPDGRELTLSGSRFPRGAGPASRRRSLKNAREIISATWISRASSRISMQPA